MRSIRTPLMLCSVLATGPALAHEGGSGDEHLNVGFYFGHDGTFEAPADPAEPATLLVDTHPWELDTVFYPLTPTDQVPFNGWSSEFPGYRSLPTADEEGSGHGYFSWQNPAHSVATPDLRLHLVSKDPALTIIDPGTVQEMVSPHVIGTDTANHHLIYYVDQSAGKEVGDVLTATFYLTDANGGLVRSQDYTLQFRILDELSPADLDLDGDVDDADFGLFFAAFTGPGVATSDPDSDLDNDGDTDDADFGLAFAAFTGPSAPANVPEPSAALLLGVGGLALARRRR